MGDLNDMARTKPSNLIRMVNRKRQAMRPTDPKPDELDFEINQEFINGEDFLIGDVRVDGARHLMFATPDQLGHLRRVRRCFMDGTFKVVSRPFYHLMSIHAFVKKDENVKQVPLLFVLMSRCQERDYVAIFQALLSRLEPEKLNVEWVMLDYEAAAWQAVRQVFQRVLVRGCVFYWTQRIYRKIMRFGLSTAYGEGGDIYKYIRELISLPFLPPEHIRGAYQELCDIGNGCGEVAALLRYVKETWIDERVWSPENWCVFRETVRTNNDVEGWHRALNSRANGCSLPFCPGSTSQDRGGRRWCHGASGV